MRRYSSPHGLITLTDERLRHILEFHPKVRNCLQHFKAAIAEPEKTARSVNDPAAIICYRYIPRYRQHLAIVIHTEKRFVITAYLARRPKNDTL